MVDILLPLIFFSLLMLYALCYTMISLGQRYRQMAIDADVFEEFKGMKEQLGANASDTLNLLIQEGKRALARRDAAKA